MCALEKKHGNDRSSRRRPQPDNNSGTLVGRHGQWSRFGTAKVRLYNLADCFMSSYFQSTSNEITTKTLGSNHVWRNCHWFFSFASTWFFTDLVKKGYNFQLRSCKNFTGGMCSHLACLLRLTNCWQVSLLLDGVVIVPTFVSLCSQFWQQHKPHTCEVGCLHLVKWLQLQPLFSLAEWGQRVWLVLNNKCGKDYPGRTPTAKLLGLKVWSSILPRFVAVAFNF
jgi:hypothetical protein